MKSTTFPESSHGLNGWAEDDLTDGTMQAEIAERDSRAREDAFTPDPIAEDCDPDANGVMISDTSVYGITDSELAELERKIERGEIV